MKTIRLLEIRFNLMICKQRDATTPSFLPASRSFRFSTSPMKRDYFMPSSLLLK